jgi:hypothetical protein
MKMRTMAVMAGALLACACQTWGPTWSEVTGIRYHRAMADRWPARIVAVGSDAVFQTPYRVTPGAYRVAVESPRHDGFPGTIQELDLKIEPCKRYYINAQFDGPVGPNWRPVVDETETIAGCRVTAS